MIEVDQITKTYGSIAAVKGITFSVGRGEIVGLLGPNGAGKTTTMRILTTYLRPTSGRASMAGYDVLEQPLEVRRRVGYLPENVPLYPEMRVGEFLAFRARLKDVPRARRKVAVSGVLLKCGLGDVEGRILGQLSRGYRQRVGLAESLLHDPDILILDEPTSGLDPIQIREVRALIRELGETHTILLSTHIMSEVEAVCGRVIIIAGGRIAVDDTLENLRVDRAVVLEARGPAETMRAALQSVPGVDRVVVTTAEGDLAGFEIRAQGDLDLREALGHRIASNGWSLRRLDTRRGSLEERFVQAVTRETLAGSSSVSAAGISPDGMNERA
jgi:ABC-2 type transport system ATP-binding protein